MRTKGISQGITPVDTPGMPATVGPTHHHSQVGGALQKSARAEQKPLRNSGGFLKSKKPRNFPRWHLRPGFDGGGVVGAKADGFTHTNGARNAMKALSKYGFWQTKWKKLGEKKKVRAAVQPQWSRRARGKDSTLNRPFSLALHLDKTNSSALK